MCVCVFVCTAMRPWLWIRGQAPFGELPMRVVAEEQGATGFRREIGIAMKGKWGQ